MDAPPSLADDVSFETAMMPVVAGVLRDGEALIGTRANPLAVQARRGRGKITALAFSPEREPFVSWKNRGWFWARLAGVDVNLYKSTDYIRNYNSLPSDSVMGALVDTKQVRKLPLTWLLGLLGAYLIVIGPLDQYVLRKAKRQMLTWITFPLYVVGFSGLIYLRAQYPAIPVVIVSASDDVGTIRRSLDFGASGFIPKRFGVETLRDAIVKVMAGDIWVPPDTDLSSAADPDMTRLRDRLVTLTPQQVRVLMMLSEGLLNKQIAYELGVSEATIKAHVSAILQKLGVESRTQAVIAAAKIAGGQWRQGVPTPQ